jgi:hypothetical protein
MTVLRGESSLVYAQSSSRTDHINRIVDPIDGTVNMVHMCEPLQKKLIIRTQPYHIRP